MKARSLHIGVNHVSPAHYGSDQPLNNAVADALAMRSLAQSAGFETSVILDNEATVSQLAEQLDRATTDLSAGDFFLISYAGHGSQLFDRNGDEPDSLDETWCLYDRMILDDELNGFYVRFRQGVRLLIVSDSCHSGSVDRSFSIKVGVSNLQNQLVIENGTNDSAETSLVLENTLLVRCLESSVARSVYLENADRYKEAKLLAGIARNLEPECSRILLAACQDAELAADGDRNGHFTSWLLNIWDREAFQGSYIELHQRLSQSMRRQQRPVLKARGSDADAFQNMRPFTI